MDIDKLRAIIEFYGEQNQVYKAVEELIELSEILIKKNNKAKVPVSIDELYSEMADVYIMFIQIGMIFELDPEKLFEEVRRKIERQIHRINEKERENE